MRPAKSANCEPDDDGMMQLDTPNFSGAHHHSSSQDISDYDDDSALDDVVDRQLEGISESRISKCSDTESPSGAVIYDLTHEKEESVLRASAIIYLGGVVIHSLEKKYRCNACGESMCKDDYILEPNDVHEMCISKHTTRKFHQTLEI